MIQLQEGETILLEARKHWFVFLAEGLLIIVTIVVPALLFGLSLWLFPDTRAYLVPHIIVGVIFFWAAWAELAFIGFLVAWTNYYLDVLLVTNKRVIDVEQIGLFRRDVATIPLHNIQDVKVEVKGIIPTLFKFGDLHVQTAGVTKEVMIRGIAEPTKVKDIISDLYQKATGNSTGGSESAA